MVIIFLVILFLANKQPDSKESDIRPHGSQYNLPELTKNNYLMGYLNKNRSSYRVSFYDINIDFDIDKKSIKGFVTIKAESIDDLKKLQVDLAENLNLSKVVYDNKELTFSREYDAVLIEFPEKLVLEIFLNSPSIMKAFKNADNPPWAGGFTWSKDKDGRDWIAVSCEGEEQEFGGQ